MQFDSYLVGDNVTASVCLMPRHNAKKDKTIMGEFDDCSSEQYFNILDNAYYTENFDPQRYYPHQYYWLKVEKQKLEVVAYDKEGCEGN